MVAERGHAELLSRAAPGLCPTFGTRGVGERGCHVRHRRRSFTASWSEYSIKCTRHLREVLFICSSGLNLTLAESKAVCKLALLLVLLLPCPVSCRPGTKGDLV